MVKLGYLTIRRTVILTDPLTDLLGKRVNVIENMKPGRYVCYAGMTQDLCGTRVTSLQIIHEDYVKKDRGVLHFMGSETESSFGIIETKYYYKGCDNFLRESPAWLKPMDSMLRQKQMGIIEDKIAAVDVGYSFDSTGPVTFYVTVNEDYDFTGIYVVL